VFRGPLTMYQLRVYSWAVLLDVCSCLCNWIKRIYPKHLHSNILFLFHFFTEYVCTFVAAFDFWWIVTGNPQWLQAVSSRKSKVRRTFESSDLFISHWSWCHPLFLSTSIIISIMFRLCSTQTVGPVVFVWEKKSAAECRPAVHCTSVAVQAPCPQAEAASGMRVAHITVLYTSLWMAATCGRSHISTLVLFSFCWNYCWLCWVFLCSGSHYVVPRRDNFYETEWK